MNGIRTAVQTPHLGFQTTKIRPNTVAIGNTRKTSVKREEPSKSTPLLPPYFINCSKTSICMKNNDMYLSSVGFAGEDVQKRQPIYSAFQTIYNSVQTMSQEEISKGRDSEKFQEIVQTHFMDLFQICNFVFQENCNMKTALQESKSQVHEYKTHLSTLLSQSTNTNSSTANKIKREEDETIKRKPKREDIEQLQKSTGSLLQDLKTMVSKSSIEMITLPSIPPRKEDESDFDYYMRLLKSRFEIVEQIVAFLKKKNQLFEQADEDLRHLVSKFGSLKTLLAENAQLSKENAHLKWLERRFDANYLTSSVHWKSNEPNYLKTIVFALQVEIFNLREIISFYNYEENTTLKIVTMSNPFSLDDPTNKRTTLPSIFEKYSDLSTLLSEKFLTAEEKAKLTRTRKLDSSSTTAAMDSLVENSTKSIYSFESLEQQSQDQIMAELLQQNKALEEENIINRDRVERLTKEIKEIREASQYIGNSNKDPTVLKNIEQNNIALQNLIRQLNSKLETKENNFLFQDTLVTSLQNKREELSKQNAKITEYLLSANEKVKELNSKISNQQFGLQVMYSITMGVLNSFIQENHSLFDHLKMTPKHFTKLLFRDVFLLHSKYTAAAVKLQSWYRGIKTRRRLLEEGKFLIRISMRRNRFAPKQVVKIEDDKDGVVSLIMEKLWEVATAATENSKSLVTLHNFISVVKSEIVDSVKAFVESELRQMNQQIQNTKKQMVGFIVEKMNKQVENKSSQTTEIVSTSRAVQSGASTLSAVGLR